MLTKELLIDLQKFVDNHIQVLHYAKVYEDSVILREDPCECIESNEMKDFIENNKKPLLVNYCSDTLIRKASLTQKYIKKLALTTGISQKNPFQSRISSRQKYSNCLYSSTLARL
ncbi:MAG: hypothetical protein ACYCYE_15775 [Clostridia bacterium]